MQILTALHRKNEKGYTPFIYSYIAIYKGFVFPRTKKIKEEIFMGKAKKFLALILGLVMCLSCLAGCGNNNADGGDAAGKRKLS